MNKITLLGRLGQKPETTNVGSTTVTKFSLATSQKWKDKEGNQKEATQWHRIEAWGAVGEIIAKFLKKGDQLAIEGMMVYDTYGEGDAKKTAAKVRLKEFHFVGGGQQAQQPQQAQQQPQPVQQATQQPTAQEEVVDDLPF